LEDHPAFPAVNDARCFGGHAIVFSVQADGRLDKVPDPSG
jgi:hypothetical protein